MEIIIVGALALWFYTLHRGRLFVRAYMFIMGMTEHGMDESSANYLAQDIGYMKATEFAPRAKEYAKRLHGGKQLPVIAEARAKGFRG